MKSVKKLGAIIMCLAVMLGCIPAIGTKAAQGAMLTVESADKTRISYNYSETKKIGLVVKNTGGKDLTNIRVTPRVSEDINSWPFEIENKDYTFTIEKLAKGEEQKIEFSFTARENVGSRYYKLPFDYTADYADCDKDGNEIVILSLIHI